MKDKKIFLCKHKRHTTRHVASTLYAALCPRWGYPPSSPDRGVPPSSSDGGTPSSPNGVPPSSPIGVPPSWSGWGTPVGIHPIRKDGGTPHWKGWGTPVWDCDLMGYPPHVNRHTDSCQNITFPHTSYAGSNKQTTVVLFVTSGYTDVNVEFDTYNVFHRFRQQTKSKAEQT